MLTRILDDHAIEDDQIVVFVRRFADRGGGGQQMPAFIHGSIDSHFRGALPLQLWLGQYVQRQNDLVGRGLGQTVNVNAGRKNADSHCSVSAGRQGRRGTVEQHDRGRRRHGGSAPSAPDDNLALNLNSTKRVTRLLHISQPLHTGKTVPFVQIGLVAE